MHLKLLRSSLETLRKSYQAIAHFLTFYCTSFIANDWLRAYWERKPFVQLNSFKSSESKISNSVTHAAILGPTLFDIHK